MNDDDLPDLHAWRVPPPPALDAHALVTRSLTPATAPARRPRLRWVVAALVATNAVIAALLVIVLARPAPKPAVFALPAGEPSTDLRVQQLLARLADEQAQLQTKLADLEQMRALVLDLEAQVDQCEHGHTVTRPPAPAPVLAPPPPPDDTRCDEVSCVLNDYPSGCCDKYKKPIVVPPAPGAILDVLDRASISRGIASVKATVAQCGPKVPAKGVVKVHVRVDGEGRVTNVEVEQTPDPALGACVAATVQRAVFVRTMHGGSFSYPFVF